jgi:hypothetical protein
MTHDEYLARTILLMGQYHVPVRRTYSPTFNYDDFFVNESTRDGPRHFAIEFLETDAWATISGKSYTYPGESALAWDGYTILVPERLRRAGRADDVIVHECVHFLQHTTEEEEKSYISFDGTNYPAYLGQRVELEAHFIQMAYMFADCAPYVESKLNETDRALVVDTLQKTADGKALVDALGTVIWCKGTTLI